MTPQQKAEYEQDMRDFRNEFIENLSRELASLAYEQFNTRSPLYSSTHCMKPAFKQLLEEKLPGTDEVRYRV